MKELEEWALEMVCLDGRNFSGIYSLNDRLPPSLLK
jgi:hypothetical protein